MPVDSKIYTMSWNFLGKLQDIKEINWMSTGAWDAKGNRLNADDLYVESV